MAEDRLAVVVGRGGTAGCAMPDGVGGEGRGCRRSDMRIWRDRVGGWVSSFSSDLEPCPTLRIYCFFLLSLLSMDL